MNDFLRAVDAPEDRVGDSEPRREPSAPRRMRPQRAVPTDRMKLETQKHALEAIGVASRGGEQPVSGADIAVRLGIIEATARLNNAFFAEAGWIEKTGKGRYMPIDAVIKYAQQRGFNETAAAALLAPAISESWYFSAIEPELRMGRPVQTDRLVAILAQAAGATAEYKPQLETVLNWLEYAGLVVITDGHVQLGQRDLQDLERHGAQERESSADGAPPSDPAATDGGGTTTKDRSHDRNSASPVLSLDFDFALTAADLKDLDADQIRAVFDAVGKVAAIKAGMR